MAKIRVHELAKEYGMSSKEMLQHLQDMKIPAKAASSALEDAYVMLARKNLAPILEQHAAEIEAAKKAEEEARAAEEAARKEAEEEARKEAEARREEERKVEAERRAAEEARRKAEEEARLEEERLRQEEEERRRKEEEEAARKIVDNAPKSIPSFNSLLEQIAQQEQVLASQQRGQGQDSASGQDSAGSADGIRAAHGKGRHAGGDAAAAAGKRGRRQRADELDSTEDNETYNRDAIIEQARREIAAAEKDQGKRSTRKQRREEQARKERENKAIQEALENDQNPEDLDVVKLGESTTVAEFAEALGVPANDVIKRIFLLGTPMTLNQTMGSDLIELIADDMGRRVKIVTPEEENSFTFYDAPEDLKHRAPVVTVMGHVDHGKTSLLDAIRHTGVASGEAGGITQHIGASEITVNDKSITFIDTPGHEAFTAMRARGAKVTDIVILVVAADDGVMPQTVEAINHAKAAGVPIVVAVNKIDKPSANPDRVRQELVEYGVIPEDWGGENMFVNVSAKQGTGIDDLLELVLLQAEVLELKANPDTFASGFVLEARLDRGRGPVATVLVNRGTLHVGDIVLAGTAHGRVRALTGARGKRLTDVLPSSAAEIQGLDSVPNAGDEFRVFSDERQARELAESRAHKKRQAEQESKKHVTLENFFDVMDQTETKELNLVVKADVQGSIEALEGALAKIDQSEVRIQVIHSAVGAISETDVTLAAASNAIIIGFGVRPDANARSSAEREGVQIKTYRVIYQAIDDIEAARVGMLAPEFEDKDMGSAEVRDIFKVPRVGAIAGCMVTQGEISRDDKVRVVRDGVVVYEGSIGSLRRFKEDVKTVKSGYECGIGIDGFQDIHLGDTIESYRTVQIEREAPKSSGSN